MAVLAQDNFNRAAVSNGWGMATDGKIWGAATNDPPEGGYLDMLSTNGTQGQIRNSPSNPGFRLHYRLGSASTGNMELLATFIPASTSDEFGLDARLSGNAGTSNLTGYRFNLSSGSLLIARFVNNSTTQTWSGPAKSITANTAYKMRFRVTGSNPTRLQGRLWLASSQEPSTWDMDVSDSSPVLTGGYGVTALPSSASWLRVDDLTVTDSGAPTVTGSVTETLQTPLQGRERVTLTGWRLVNEFSRGSEMVMSGPVSVARVVETVQQVEQVLAKALPFTRRDITESSRQFESVQIAMLRASDPDALMQVSDLVQQYERVMHSLLAPSIEYCAKIYYGGGQYGELDVQLKGSPDLYELRTVRQVSNFLQAHLYPEVIKQDAPVFYDRCNQDTALSLQGGVTTNEPGVIASDPSIRFDGSTGYGVVANMTLKDWNQYSLELWIKFADLSRNGYCSLVATDNPVSTNHGMRLDVSTGSYHALYVANGYEDFFNSIDVPTTWQFNQWYHVVATYDNTRLKLYLNGTKVGDIASSGNLSNPAYALTLARNPVLSTFFAGWIDEFALYSYALSQTQITAHYQARNSL